MVKAKPALYSKSRGEKIWVNYFIEAARPLRRLFDMEELEADDWRNNVIAPTMPAGKLYEFRKTWGELNRMSPDQMYETEREWREVLGECRYRYIGLSRIGERKPNVAVGGLCIVYTGDLETTLRGMRTDDIGRWLEETFPRADQIIDTVGQIGSVGEYSVVFEDSLFASLIEGKLGLPSTAQQKLTDYLKAAGKKSVEYIKRFLEFSMGDEVQVKPVFTSEIEPKLRQAAAELAETVGIKKKTDEKFLIRLMKTFKWPELLRELGYISEGTAVCAEPAGYFLEAVGDYVKSPNPLRQFLLDNTWGRGMNQGYLAAGFLPSLRLDRTAKPSKFLSFESVPGKSNAARLLSQSYREANIPESMFPIETNPIIRDSVNLLASKPAARRVVTDILDKRKEQLAAGRDDGGRKLKLQQIQEGLIVLAEENVKAYEAMGFLDTDGKREVLERLV